MKQERDGSFGDILFVVERGVFMSAERQEVINRIQALPDTAIIDLLEYLNNRDKEQKLRDKKNAFSELQAIRKSITENNVISECDEKVEYRKYLEEKYAGTV